MADWHFATLSPNAVRRDPFESVFFSGDDESDAAYARTDGLVRETIQNALDAAVDRENPSMPVRVRYAIYQDCEHASEMLARWSRTLVPHLSALDLTATVQSGDSSALRWLVYEDFGTRGLDGDPKRHRRPALDGSDGRQDFYWFWRNIGRSGKSGQDLGRWGLGKTVLPAASSMNTMLGLTVRDSDLRRLLLGQCVLKIHAMGDEEYAPEGFFGDSDGGDSIIRPIEDRETCDEFSNAFRLARTPDQPGLSVVVPECAEDLRAKEILRSAIIHFFVPILRGELIVEVEGPDLAHVVVTADSIEAVAVQLDWDGSVREKKHAPPNFEFAEWAITQQQSESLVNFSIAGTEKAPSWSDKLASAELLSELRCKYAGGERIAIRQPMTVKLKDGSQQATHFDIFLWREPGLETGEDHFVREGMTISGIRVIGSRRGLRGIVLVDDSVLSGLLGDCEGPAHTSWSKTEERPKRQYAVWTQRVDFVRQSLWRLDELLSPPPDEIDREALRDIFGIDQIDDDANYGGHDSDAKDAAELPDGPDLGDITTSPRWHEIAPLNDGFKIRKPANACEPPPLPARLVVQVAYDMPRGNPLGKWSRFDFDFKAKGGSHSLRMSGKHVDAKALAGNVLELRIKSAEFSFAIRGFDTARDLVVRVDSPSPGTDDDAVTSELEIVDVPVTSEGAAAQ